MGERTGKPYQPSNGSEGWRFTGEFCEQCRFEKFLHTAKKGDLACGILSATIVWDPKDEQYPKEWIYDENDNPTCTAFKKWDWGNEQDGWNDPPEEEPIDPNQLSLFS